MLEDTSFAIHPGKEKDAENGPYYDIGKLLDHKKIDNTYFFNCENGKVAIRFYTDIIVQVVMNPTDEPKMEGSRAVIALPENVAVEEQQNEAHLTLKTDKLEVVIKKSPFRITINDHDGRELVAETDRGMGFKKGGEVIAYKVMHDNDHFYGFGEKSGHLDKRGEKYEMWNTDVYAPHNPETDPLYESIPYFMTLREGRAHGVFFDNTFRTVFDMKSEENNYSFWAEGGQLDYYVFAGPEPKTVLEQYTHLTGRMPLPPKWALGYHQSRYSYESEAEVRELAKTFIEHGIPLDAIHLDIHYMNGYRVFTFDSERFPTPEKLIADLREMGIRIIPIVDSGVKKDPEYHIYQEGVNEDLFCKYIEGAIYFGDVWPGTSAFPDFTDDKVRKWWGDKHQFYTDLGIEGIWNDMNEPAVFNETKTMNVAVMHRNDGNPATHRELHNIYGFLMEEATYEGMKDQLEGKRPFLLTRAGYAGVQRYAAVWTGDNRSFWEHLQMSLPMVMNLGLSGVPLAGPDVGGFAHDTNAELLTRWTQVGAFTPFFRNHSALGFKYQEPWQFGEIYETMMKKYIRMRYEWMPQLYSLFYQASKTGIPVMRPLMLEFPDDEKTYNLNDQFMIGDNVIVAPILAPSITDRAVYLPEGEWVELFTDVTYEGKLTHLIHAELDHMPIFVKRGSALMQTDWTSNTNKTPKTMTMHVYASDSDESYRFTFYDDDGETFEYQEDGFLELDIELKSSADSVVINVLQQNGVFLPVYKEINVNIAGLMEGQRVIINGETSGEKHVIPLK
ncbi:alpha-glucosidase [Lentibacillus populi]|uniref:Alpha-glucosidase n=1 Tax=Lentibacillus populi TaxID=1827502 RepID=A0A9W5X4L9_9BACI|nr:MULTISPECIES: TIM-barrel domain-containing protein [Bacillaceae]MBT2216779.1 glycoside hydrolase family 31 protein [Virgibacillus dakarensis]GGB32561.1 alpha-glucosidase [Lentibacillus populi]